jgi:phage terminase large subunit GpA-like protein
VRDFLDSKDNPQLLKTWVNTFLGETWEEKGRRLEWSELMGHREDYDTRDNIPEEITLITGAVDIQDDRAEVEFVGWGDDHQTWSLGYHKVYGDPSTPEFWQDLKDLLGETFIHPTFGEIAPRSIAIDSGGHYTSSVYKFTQLVPRTVAIKGVSGAGKPMVGRPLKNTIGNARVLPLGVDTIKEVVVARLKISDPDAAGYNRFPAHYDDDYFRGLTAEELKTTYFKGFAKNEWVKIRPRNEPFDLRVYNTAALEMLQVDLNAQRREALRRAAKPVTQEPEKPAKAVKPGRPQSSWANRWKNG